MKSFSLDRGLPFYPTYEIEVCGQVTIWWFAKDFSQSRYNYKHIPIGSNACTIITVLLAARFHYHRIEISSSFEFDLAPDIVCAFAECVLEGNEIHEKLRKIGALQNINLTVPEAIHSAGSKLRHVHEWKSVLYMTDLGTTLYKNLKQHLGEWYQTPLYEQHPDLYIILIADHRSVLFVFQDETDLDFVIETLYFGNKIIGRQKVGKRHEDSFKISLLDSHQHLQHGAFIAQVPRMRLKALCQWFNCMIAEYFNSQPDCYELSFLYFKKDKSKSMKSQ